MYTTKKRKMSKGPLAPILVIGGSGFVGSYFLRLSKHHNSNWKFVFPTHDELDITQKEKISLYVSTLQPRFIINFAALTSMDESEKEKNNKKGKTWNINYVGVKNISALCRKLHVFLIHISTDAVFPGTDEYSGPYEESDTPPGSGKDLNWYGYTKLKAEEEILQMNHEYAIIRISHPFGNPKSERDLVRKTIRDIQSGHRLFSDQLFTPTFLDDLTKTIWKILSLKKTGIFHVGCRGLVARIEFDRYLVKKLKLKNPLRVGSLQEFITAGHRAPRTRLGGFVTSQTQQKLGLQFHTWQEALGKTLRRV